MIGRWPVRRSGDLSSRGHHRATVGGLRGNLSFAVTLTAISCGITAPLGPYGTRGGPVGVNGARVPARSRVYRVGGFSGRIFTAFTLAG